MEIPLKHFSLLNKYINIYVFIYLFTSFCDTNNFQCWYNYLTAVQVDVLVNNGARGQLAWIKETPLEVDRALLELNVVGTISITKAVLPYMLQQQGGDIVVVSSGNGKFGIII